MNKTQTYYNQNHKILIEQYNSITLTPLNQLFDKYIKPKQKVLDIGFGSGRDLRYIQSLKTECYSVDSCKSFIDDLRKDNYELLNAKLIEKWNRFLEKVNRNLNIYLKSVI